MFNGAVSTGAYRDSPEPRQPEMIVAELRPSAGGLAWSSLLLVAVAGALGYLVFRLDGWQRWVAIGVAALLVLVGFILPLAAWSSRRYTITTRRTILREGMLAHSRREILHARVLEIAMHRSAGQRFAGSGDVLLELGQGRTAVLRSVRSPRLVQEALSDLVEAQRAEYDGRRATGEQPL